MASGSVAATDDVVQAVQMFEPCKAVTVVGHLVARGFEENSCRSALAFAVGAGALDLDDARYLTSVVSRR